MAAFARHQIMCILSEEMEFSEHRMYLEDLIGDYDVCNEAQEIAEAMEEAKLDTLDPNLRPPKPTVSGPTARKSSDLWITALRRKVKISLSLTMLWLSYPRTLSLANIFVRMMLLYKGLLKLLSSSKKRILKLVL